MATKAGRVRQQIPGELERACRDFDVEEWGGEDRATAMSMQLTLLRAWRSASLLQVSRSDQHATEGDVAREQTGHPEDHLLNELNPVDKNGVGHAA